MHTHEIVFMVALTIIAVIWVRAFRQFIYSQVEAKSYEAIKKYSAEQKNIDGDFVERDNSMVFYETTDFKKQTKPSFIAHDKDSPHDDIIPNMKKFRYSTWPYEYEYNKVKKEPVPFIYNDTGILWEEKMGVDFLQDGWYEDLMDIRDRLYKNVTKDINAELEQFWKESEGYSRFIYTRHYAFISNACVNVKSGQVNLHLKSDMLVNKVLGEFKWKDFYFNVHKVTKDKMPTKNLPKKPLGLLIAHPRSVKNAYQFLEGTSMLAHIALHPEIFPRFKELIVIASNREQIPDDWNMRALEYMLGMFPEDYRPTVVFPHTEPRFVGHNVVCDKIITLLRNWEPIGSGSFIGTALAADFFRASAYVYENYYPPTNRGDKLYLTINRRVTNRFILNLDKFVQKINQKLLDYYDYDNLVLDELTIDQRVQQLTKTDVFFSVYGTGLANMLFMTRESYLIEAYPPHWYWSCYQRFAKAAGVKSAVFKSRGERGPECKDAEDKSAQCQQKGIRDRNFNMSVNDGIKYLWDARTYVLQYKYHRDPITMRFM